MTRFTISTTSFLILLLSCIALTFFITLTTAEVAVQDGVKVDSSVAAADYSVDLNDATFEHHTQAATGGTTGDWFVEFYAPWCGHCKSLAPIWSQLAKWSRDESLGVSIAKLDATSSTMTSKRFDIRGFPTLKYFSNGKMYDYQGPRTLTALQSYIENREWAKEGATEGKLIPKEISTSDFIYDYIRSTMNDITQLFYRKPGATGILLTIGFLIGILVSMLLFIVFLEQKPIVHRIAPPGTAGKARGNSATQTNPAVKKGQ